MSIRDAQLCIGTKRPVNRCLTAGSCKSSVSKLNSWSDDRKAWLLANFLTFLDKVTDCTDTGDSVSMVFVDFPKALGNVSHNRLAIKPESHGIIEVIFGPNTSH